MKRLSQVFIITFLVAVFAVAPTILAKNGPSKMNRAKAVRVETRTIHTQKAFRSLPKVRESVVDRTQKVVVTRVRFRPPAPLKEVIPPRPSPLAVWISGYWMFDPVLMEWVWVPGYWELTPIGSVWVPGYWTFRDGFYVWISGHWIL